MDYEKKVEELLAVITNEIEVKDQKEVKVKRLELVKRIVLRLDEIKDLNLGIANKTLMLVEYTVQSIDDDRKEYFKKYRSMLTHLSENYGLVPKGETSGKYLAIGLTFGTSFGVVFGSMTSNISIGIAIGTGVGLSLGAGIGAKKESELEKANKLL